VSTDTATTVLALATVLVAIVAAFQVRISAWLQHPSLQVYIVPEPPDCGKIPLRVFSGAGQLLGERDSIYFRLRVKNRGNLRAGSVEVRVTTVRQRKADGTLFQLPEFLPMNLRWTHTERSVMEAISPGTEKHCNLGFVAGPIQPATTSDAGELRRPAPSPETEFELALEVLPNDRSHALRPGTYQLAIQVSAANASPVTTTFELTLEGRWFDDAGKMLREGVGIRSL
jgi:hypothetical protein